MTDIPHFDAFTQEFVEAAFADRQHGVKPVKIAELIGAMQYMYWQWRDAQIEIWAISTLTRVPASKLDTLIEVIAVNLSLWREFWELPDGDISAEWAAHGLARLRWLYQEANERVPELRYTDDDLQCWLDMHNPPVQLALF